MSARFPSLSDNWRPQRTNDETTNWLKTTTEEKTWLLNFLTFNPKKKSLKRLAGVNMKRAEKPVPIHWAEACVHQTIQSMIPSVEQRVAGSAFQDFPSNTGPPWLTSDSRRIYSPTCSLRWSFQEVCQDDSFAWVHMRKHNYARQRGIDRLSTWVLGCISRQWCSAWNKCISNNSNELHKSEKHMYGSLLWNIIPGPDVVVEPSAILTSVTNQKILSRTCLPAVALAWQKNNIRFILVKYWYQEQRLLSQW